MTKFVKMKSYSKCKRYAGVLIKCPKCQHIDRVFHLEWSALTCQSCKEMIDKYDWLIEKGKHSKLQ